MNLALRLGLSVEASYDMILVMILCSYCLGFDLCLRLRYYFISNTVQCYCTVQGSVSPGYRGLVVLEDLMKCKLG